MILDDEVGAVVAERPTKSRVRAFAPILVAAALLALVPIRYHDSAPMMRVVTEGGQEKVYYGLAFSPGG